MNSHVFAPSVGGSESACLLLVEGLVRRGFEVRVITQTPGGKAGSGDFEVYRRPSWWECLRHVRWADVVVHSNISLRAAWPLVVSPRPWVVIHHSTLVRDHGGRRLRDWLKQGSAVCATNIAVSQSMADSLFSKSHVLGNGYRDSVFHQDIDVPRNSDFIFVGRLVPSKGADLAIQAIARLRKMGLSTSLTIVGSGPCEEQLHELAEKLGVTNHIRFLGSLPPEEIAEELNRHRILLAPSLRNETFGLVVLEALACGCLPVVSDVGGLPEAAGPHGVTFPENDLVQLVETLHHLLLHPGEVQQRLEGADSYLEQYKEDRIIDTYAQVIESAAQKARPVAEFALSSLMALFVALEILNLR